MLRLLLQRAARLSPRGARVAYSLLPAAVKRALAPLLHPIGVTPRAGALPLPTPQEPTRKVDRIVRGTGVEDDESSALRGRLFVWDPAEDLHAFARANSITDAVVLGDLSTRDADAARRLGYRTTPTEGGAAPSWFPSVSVIVVSYENRELLQSCVNGLVRNTPWRPVELIVVDNASEDGTQELLRGLELPGWSVRVIQNAENLGFGKACNQGLRAATGEYVALLNDDTVTGPGWLPRLVGHLERDPRLGIVGPVTNQIANEARVATQYTTLGGMEAFAVQNGFDNAGVVEYVGAIALFCAVARRSVLASVGFLDERFEVGMFEDDDLCRKLAVAGLRAGIARDAFVHHVGHASFGRLTDARYLRIWEANKQRFESKWGESWKPPA